jgi:hypothetical protein
MSDGKPITHTNLEDEISDWDHKPLQPKDFYTENTVGFKRATDQSFVRSVRLSELRAQHPDLPIQILLASDGLQNTTEQTLEQQAIEILAKGPEQYIRDYQAEHFAFMGYEDNENKNLMSKDAGKVVPVNPFADDTTLLRVTIPPREAAAKQTAAA